MGCTLSAQDRAYWEEILARAEPYPDDHPALNTLCGGISTIFSGNTEDYNEDRMNATFAKRILEKYTA